MSLWFSMASTRYNNTRITKTLSAWDTHQISIFHWPITILIPTCRFFDTILDDDDDWNHGVDLYIYRSNIGCRPSLATKKVETQMQLQQCLLTRALSVTPHIFTWFLIFILLKNALLFLYPLSTSVPPAGNLLGWLTQKHHRSSHIFFGLTITWRKQTKVLKAGNAKAKHTCILVWYVIRPSSTERCQPRSGLEPPLNLTF